MASSCVAQTACCEATKDRLQCSICNDYFREPRALDCMHKFCLKCLQELCNQQISNGSKIICPLCSKETRTKDVADLPQCHMLSALVEEFNMQTLLLEGRGSEIACQACVEENQAVSRCEDCDKFLCKACQKAHQRLTLMKSHKISSLDQFRSGKVVYKSKLRDHVQKCKKHPAENVSIFCNKCEQLICSTCLVQAHAQHSFSGADEALEKCKQDLKKLIAEVEKTKGGLYTAMAKTGTSLKKLQSRFADSNRKISQKAADEIAKIKEKEQQLRHDLEKVYLDSFKIFEAAQASNRQDVCLVERMLQESNQLTGQDSCYEILRLKKMLFPNLKELIQTCKQPVELSDRLYLMDFEGDQSFGKLVFDDEDKSEPEGVQATGIAGGQMELRDTSLFQNFSQAEEVMTEIIEDKQQKTTPKSKQKKKLNGSDPGSVESLIAEVNTKSESTEDVKEINEDKPQTSTKKCKTKNKLKKTDSGLDESLILEDKTKSESRPEVASDSETARSADSIEHWIFTKHIKTIGSDQKTFGCAFDVAVFSNNEIVIVDTKLKRLIRYSLTSEPRSDKVSSVLKIKGLTDPRQVSVNKHDHLIVLDNHTSTVNTYDKKYKPLHQFIPGRRTNQKPTCLAVDECNQIAVGYKYQKQIFLHSSEGSFIKAVHATMIDNRLVTYKQKFIYTNYWNKTLYAQKYTGDMVFCVNVPSSSTGYWGPNCLCCDKTGNIYVAVRAFGTNMPADEVIRFSPDGTYLGTVITGCGLPHGITLTPDDNHLIVATNTSVSIFRQVIFT
ncbi:E3 ubiquitin-protein ligase TRIM56-like [Patiria miniata]|uniref:Uncharacterized protein n=1 Tax=Patiria miniata TaxID=46514 RepID=A0A914A667_PATMI|nr:E3 ubiquitin-protein ligase TRIM56-like [Patiria miniata]